MTDELKVPTPERLAEWDALRAGVRGAPWQRRRGLVVDAEGTYIAEFRSEQIAEILATWPEMYDTLAAAVRSLTERNAALETTIGTAQGWLSAMLERREYEDDTELRELRDSLLPPAHPRTVTDG